MDQYPHAEAAAQLEKDRREVVTEPEPQRPPIESAIGKVVLDPEASWVTAAKNS